MDFLGSVVYINNSMPNPKRIKIFDFKQKRVLVIFCNENEYAKDRAIYDQTAVFFNPPKILWSDDGQRMYIEELISATERTALTAEDKDKIMLAVIDMYKRKMTELAETGKNDYTEIVDKYGIFSETQEYFGRFTVAVQHNDLSSLNIVYDKEGICRLIDWEHFGENVFFYDCMRLIINDAQQGYDTYRLQQYLKGEYDDALTGMFDAAKERFDVDDRERYIKAAYICMANRGIEDGVGEEVFKDLAAAFEKILTHTRSSLEEG